MPDKHTQLLAALQTIEDNIKTVRALIAEETERQAIPQQAQSQPVPQPVTPAEVNKEIVKEPTVTIQQAQSLQDASLEGEIEEEVIPVIGREGFFDGMFMIADGDGKKFQLPPNYISKSMLVVGDRLRIVNVDETGSQYSFKQLKNILRKEVEGIVTKKDNQWAVHTDAGVFYIVAAAIKFHNVDIGDKIIAIIPDETVPVPVEWAAFKEVVHKQESREQHTPKKYPPQRPDQEKLTDEYDKQGGEEPKTSEQPASQPIQQIYPAFDQQLPVTQEQKPQLQTQPVIEQPKQESVLSPPPVSPQVQAPTPVDKGAGEVSIQQQPAHEPSVGEVDLTEEQLWELR